MAPQERTDQPSDVSTEDAPRPRDEHVVTSDSPADQEPPAADPSSDDTPGETGTPPAQTTDDSPPSGDKSTAAPKRNRSAERRIKRLSAKLASERERNDRNETRIAELEQQIGDLRAATPAAPEPQLTDFNSPQEYAKAYAKWEADTASPPAGDTPPANRKPVDTRGSRPEPPPPDGEIVDFHTRGKEKLGDEFTEALQEPDTAVNQQMAEFIMDSDYGPEIYVHLANNVEESRKIYDMGPDRAKKALDALQAKAKKGDLDVEGMIRIEGDDDDAGDEEEPDPKPKPKKRGGRQTSAPTPPDSKPDPGSTALEPDPEAESMDDYAARRRKEEARKAGFPV